MDIPKGFIDEVTKLMNSARTPIDNEVTGKWTEADPGYMEGRVTINTNSMKADFLEIQRFVHGILLFTTRPFAVAPFSCNRDNFGFGPLWCFSLSIRINHLAGLR